MKFLSSNLGLFLAVLLTSAVSFAVFYYQLNTTTRSPLLVPQVMLRVDSVVTCVARNGNSNKECIDDATLLLADVPRTQFEISKSSNFDVYIQRDALIFHKQKCAPADLELPSFTWALYPVDPAFLPPDRKKDGYFAGTEDFNKKGFRIGSQCLLVLRLPTDHFRKFEAGQYISAAGKWLWFVT